MKRNMILSIIASIFLLIGCNDSLEGTKWQGSWMEPDETVTYCFAEFLPNGVISETIISSNGRNKDVYYYKYKTNLPLIDLYEYQEMNKNVIYKTYRTDGNNMTLDNTKTLNRVDEFSKMYSEKNKKMILLYTKLRKFDTSFDESYNEFVSNMNIEECRKKYTEKANLLQIQ